MATKKNWQDLTFSEYSASLSNGGNPFTSVFKKRLSDGDMSDEDVKRLQKKTGYGKQQVKRLSNKYIAELGAGIPKPGAPTPTPTPETEEPFLGMIPVGGEVPPQDSFPAPSIPLNSIQPATPTPTPAPTPEPIPEPTYTPGFSQEDFDAQLNTALSKIRDSYGGQIEGLQASIDKQASDYQGQIGTLQETISGQGNTLTNYARQISSLGDQLRQAERDARQVKVTDATYIGNNSASGVRFNRSNNFRRSAFALGTGQLNRSNMRDLQISNVNL